MDVLEADMEIGWNFVSNYCYAVIWGFRCGCGWGCGGGGGGGGGGVTEVVSASFVGVSQALDCT